MPEAKETQAEFTAIAVDSSASLKQAEELRKELQQPVCFGACGCLSWWASCCTVGCLLPIILFAALSGDTASWLPFIPLGIGLVWAVVAGLPVLCGEKAAAPAPVKPLTKPLRTAAAAAAGATKKKVVVIVNPFGGKKLGPKLLAKYVQPKLEAAGFDIEVKRTQFAGHPKVMLQSELDLDGLYAVLVIGGDGTLHEAVNGLLKRADKKRVPLGLVPGGSGNSFLTDFGLGQDPAGAVDAIVAGHVAGIDAVQVTYGPDPGKHVTYSINVIGWCRDQTLSALNIDSWRPLLGTARYDVCAVFGLLKGLSGSAMLETDGKKWAEGAKVVFANSTQHFGKGMRAAPSARLDDGLMDLGNLTGSRGEMINGFTQIHTGALANLGRGYQGAQVKKAVIIAEEERGLFNIDGEPTTHHQQRIEMVVVPGAFEIFVPASSTDAVTTLP